MNRGILVALLAIAPLQLQAHDSVALNFFDEEITLVGTVRDVRWVNPHASFEFEVANDDGTVDRWVVELLAVVALQRRGFNFDAIQDGSQIEMTARVGYRDHTLLFTGALLPDGTIVTRTGAPPE